MTNICHVGIIEFPSLHKGKVVYPKDYIDWIESSGAIAVLIPYNLSHSNILACLETINGLIWTGGSIESSKYSTKQYTTYMNALRFCFNTIRKYNDAGKYFPLWGTCLGFEILASFSKTTNISTLFKTLTNHPCNENTPILFNTNTSRLKKWFPVDLRKKMSSQSCSEHHHRLGIDLDYLDDNVTIVSTQYDFVNMIEYKHYPFYGVQFHPERPFDTFSKKSIQGIKFIFIS